ncbi:MAG: hypothetical protein EA357_04845 [Micavibrio sp.]|nr:MAG: hypothetical protein EA357_04845 [Micavibrio sp.]
MTKKNRFPIFFFLAALCVFSVSGAGTGFASGGDGQERYAVLRDNAVNLRSGPGQRYPVRWVLRRAGMPVKIIRDFDVWRQIELFDGETGWVHVNLLSRGKNALVLGEAGSYTEMRAAPSADAGILLRLESGVIVKLDQCVKAWCSIGISGYKGWLPASVLWGDTAEN